MIVWKPATTWPEALLPQTDTLSTQGPYLTAPEATYDLRVVKTATADSALWRRITLADGTGEWTLIPQEKDNPHRLDVAATLALVSTADPQTGAYSAVAVMSNGKLLVSCDQGITWTARDGYALPEGFGSPLRVAQDEGGNVWAENADQRIWQAQRR